MGYAPDRRTRFVSPDMRRHIYGALGATGENIAIQLKKVRASDYAKIDKTFKENKPHTTVSITMKGSKALNAVLDEMEGLIRAIRA